MDDNTFINMDEVRGWGIRGLRECHSKDMIKQRDKGYIWASIGLAITVVGLCIMADGYNKAGKWQGAMNLASRRADEAFLRDMDRHGYKLAGK